MNLGRYMRSACSVLLHCHTFSYFILSTTPGGVHSNPRAGFRKDEVVCFLLQEFYSGPRNNMSVFLNLSQIERDQCRQPFSCCCSKTGEQDPLPLPLLAMGRRQWRPYISPLLCPDPPRAKLSYQNDAPVQTAAAVFCFPVNYTNFLGLVAGGTVS